MTVDGVEYYNQTNLTSLGFNPKMIAEFLPDPILRPNPYYKSGPQMKLWKKDDVDAVVITPSFQERKSARKSRVDGAKKAVETKKEKIRVEVDKAINNISVIRIDPEDLVKNALDAKYAWYSYIASQRDEPMDKEVYDAPEEVQQRWRVNYVRHNLTKYDSDLYNMSGKVGCHEEYIRYKRAVLDEIAKVYPELAEECERQNDSNNKSFINKD